MESQTISADEWELAWEEYVAALTRRDATQPDRFRRGHIRAAKTARYALRRARTRLQKLDPEFCQRMGI